jgi:hypothetical protein
MVACCARHVEVVKQLVDAGAGTTSAHTVVSACSHICCKFVRMS